MVGFVFKRLAAGVLTLWVVISLTFMLLRGLPGGPFDRDRKVPPQVQAQLEAQYHLNDPLPVQYLKYLNNLAQGDLGPSYTFRSRQVVDLVAEGASVSFQLGLMALVVGLFMGIGLGTLAGNTSSAKQDRFFSFLGICSLSLPTFVFGGLLVLAMALWLKWLPAATLATPQHFILPVLTLAMTPFAYSFLLVRTAVREVKQHTFVRVKRSFGISEGALALRHILRNSLLPLLSILGPIAAALITGSFAVEAIFAIPGIGKHFVFGVMNRDYPLVMGITVLYSVVLITFNTVTDLLYGFLDPRLRDFSQGANP